MPRWKDSKAIMRALECGAGAKARAGTKRLIIEVIR
jgi:hypothetical protein